MTPKQKKLLISVVGLGLFAVLVDWLVLGGGPTTGGTDQHAELPPADDSDAAGTGQTNQAPADADETPPHVNIDTVNVDELIKRFEAIPNQRGLDDRLRQLAGQMELEAGHMRDAFAVHPAWIDPHEPDEPEQQDGEATEHDRPDPVTVEAERFKQEHRLQAVMPERDQGMAVVSGHTLRVGQSLDGFTLVHTDSHLVVFEARGHHVNLHLPRP